VATDNTKKLVVLALGSEAMVCALQRCLTKKKKKGKASWQDSNEELAKPLALE